MVKVFEGTDEEYYMDGILRSNLDTAKKVVAKDWDMLFVIDGYEGAGKSVKAQQDAKYCDPTFDLTRIVFTPKEFEKAVMSAKKFQAVLYDEAYGGLSGKGAMTTINRTIVKMLTEIRARNLFIFIVLPTIFELDKYVALWRSRALIHVYSADNFERGFFAFYNIHKKKSLYMNGKKFYSYKTPSPNFTGRFTNHYTVNKDEYKKKKLIETSKDSMEEQSNRLMKRMYEIIVRLEQRKFFQREIGEIIGVSQGRVAQIKQIFEESGTNKLIMPYNEGK